MAVLLGFEAPYLEIRPTKTCTEMEYALYCNDKPYCIVMIVVNDQFFAETTPKCIFCPLLLLLSEAAYSTPPWFFYQ